MPEITTEEYFEEVFPNEVKMEYQRKIAMLRPFVDVWQSSGDQLNLPYMGDVGMNTKARHGNITVFQPEEGRIPVVMEDGYSAIYFDKMDQDKTQIQLQRKYMQNTVWAAQRRVDQIITTALDLGATPALSPTAPLDDDVILDTMTALRESDADESTLFGVISPVGHAQLIRNSAEITTIDYNGDKPLVKLPKMFQWMGIQWMVHSGLPLNGTTRSGFVWNQESVVLGINDDIRTRTDWDLNKHGWLTTTTLSMGAAVRDAEGCYQILIDES